MLILSEDEKNIILTSNNKWSYNPHIKVKR